MSAFQVLGYMVSTTADFLRKNSEERGMKGVFEQLSPLARDSAGEPQARGLVSRSRSWPSLNRTIAATLGEGLEEPSAARARELGGKSHGTRGDEHVRPAPRACSRLGLFAKKLPDLWRRDCSKGNPRRQRSTRSSRS